MAQALTISGTPERMYALVDERDGTLYCGTISAEFDMRSKNMEHEEVAIYTDAKVARAAALHYMAQYDPDMKLTLVEVEIVAVKKGART